MTTSQDQERERDDEDDKGGFGSFCVRDMLPFEDNKVMLPGISFDIIVRPEETCILHRIIMHRGIAGKLALEELRIGAGDHYRRKGSGSCEVFQAEGIPNWTPQKLYMTPEEPLVIRVRNMSERPLKLVGQTITFRRERVAVRKPASRTGAGDIERGKVVAAYPLKGAATVAGDLPLVQTNKDDEQ